MDNDKELVVHNPKTGSGYPLASLIGGDWSMSLSFDEAEFAEWVTEQGGQPVEIEYTEPMTIAYSAVCPNCDEPVTIFLKNDDSGFYEFECGLCSESSDVDLTGVGDEE
jgi:hypothetical protein